jgi:hypothetical protein
MTCDAGRARPLCTLLVLGLLAGCKGFFGSQGLPDDPLLLDRYPLRAKAIASPPITIAYAEPFPPTNPFATSRPVLAGPPQKAGPTSGTLTNWPRPAVPDDEPE